MLRPRLCASHAPLLGSPVDRGGSREAPDHLLAGAAARAFPESGFKFQVSSLKLTIDRRVASLLLDRFRAEADLFAFRRRGLRGRRSHELSDCDEYDLKLAIISLFQIVQLASQLSI